MALGVAYVTYQYGLMEWGGLVHVGIGGVLAGGSFYIKRWIREYRGSRKAEGQPDKLNQSG